MPNPPPPGALMVPLAFAKQIAHSTTEIDGRLHAAAVPWPGAPPEPEPRRDGSFDSPPGEAEQLAFLFEALAAFGLAAVTTDDLALAIKVMRMGIVPAGCRQADFEATRARLRSALERTADA